MPKPAYFLSRIWSMVLISNVWRSVKTITTSKSLYKYLLRECKKLPEDAGEFYKHSIKQMAYEVHVLHEGYSKTTEEGMVANCTCTLVKGNKLMIVDTMTSWDKSLIVEKLKSIGVACDAIEYVVSTHGHSDHIGNNNLFLNAKHIVGFSVSFKDLYYIHPFETGEPFIIDEHLKIIATPGHTLADVSVLVDTKDKGLVAITGDLFEREEDIANPSLWKYVAGSDDPDKQHQNRNKILQIAEWIVPGHGPMFKVTQEMKVNHK